MKSESKRSTRRLIILGSTGSVGINTLAVAEHLAARSPLRFEIVGLAAGANADALLKQAVRHNVRHVAIADAEQAGVLKDVEHVHAGESSAKELIEAVAQPGDLVVGAMVGAAGIPAMLAAIERGCDIALANKETLVAAGALVMPKIRQRGVALLPLDSEHSAIFQCLQDAHVHRSSSSLHDDSDSDSNAPAGMTQLHDQSAEASSHRHHQSPASVCSGRHDVTRIVLTASGGPFRTWPKDRMQQATVAEALNHPTWNMGPKVTIDSASLMNKALEIIEAYWLFDLPADKIDVIIHPQSIVHSFVEFVDGSVLAQLGATDMRTPIQYALTWPDRFEGCSRKMDWLSLGRMDFEQVDPERFIAPQLAYRVIETGGTMGAVFNAANEAAVAAFIDGKIQFGQIQTLVQEALEEIEVGPVHTINDVFQADSLARQFVQDRLHTVGRGGAATAVIADTRQKA